MRGTAREIVIVATDLASGVFTEHGAGCVPRADGADAGRVFETGERPPASGGAAERFADGQLACRQRIGAQAGLVQPVLDDLGRRQLGRRQDLAQDEAGLAELDAPQAQRPDPELPANEFVQTNTSGDDIPAGCREVDLQSVLAGKRLDLLGLDEGDVLAGLVVAAEVAITDDAGSRLDKDTSMFVCRTTL
jgi:hypothetical protein